MRNSEKKGQAPVRDLDLVNSEAARRSVGYVVVYRNGKIVEDWLDKQVA